MSPWFENFLTAIAGRLSPEVDPRPQAACAHRDSDVAAQGTVLPIGLQGIDSAFSPIS
jgi:hypothetical protein